MKHSAPVTHHPWRVACAAFLLSLSVFVALILVSNPSLDEEPAEADSTVGKRRTLTLFFHGGDQELTGIVTVSTDTRLMSVHATAYPITSAVQTAFAEGKSEYARMVFDREQNIESDAAVSFSVDRISAFLVYTGETLSLTLPEPAIGLPAGDATLTPNQITDLLRYTAWSSGPVVRQRLHAQTVATLINRFLISSRDINKDFAKLTELCDDRLHIAQFAAVREELTALAAENDGSLCRYVLAGINI